MVSDKYTQLHALKLNKSTIGRELSKVTCFNHWLDIKTIFCNSVLYENFVNYLKSTSQLFPKEIELN